MCCVQYATVADFICNWMGNKAWYLGLKWDGQSVVNSTPDHPWVVNGKTAGIARTALVEPGVGYFTFLQVHNAGHMVPMNQPENALAMVEQFFSGEF